MKNKELCVLLIVIAVVAGIFAFYVSMLPQGQVHAARGVKTYTMWDMGEELKMVKMLSGDGVGGMDGMARAMESDYAVVRLKFFGAVVVMLGSLVGAWLIKRRDVEEKK